MFNSKIKLYTRNILDTGTFTVTGDADSGYPEARLHDRDISLYWKDVSESIVNFNVDQGASPLAVNALIISGHDFSGSDIAWQWSEDDSTWHDAVSVWTQSDNLQIVKTLATALTKRYWRVLLGNVALTTTTTSTVSTTSSTASTVSTSSSTTTTTA